MVWAEDPRRAFPLPTRKEEFLPLQEAAPAAAAEAALAAAPVGDLQDGCAWWFDLAERHLVAKLELESPSVQHYLGRARGIKLVQKPLMVLHLPRQRRHDMSSTEAWWGLLRCWRGLRRWGLARRGSKARRA